MNIARIELVIEPTEFKDERTGKITFGFRIYNDHSQTYNNTWKSIPRNNLDVLSLAIQSEDPQIIEMLSSVYDKQSGLCIDQTCYDWEDIEHLWGNQNVKS